MIRLVCFCGKEIIGENYVQCKKCTVKAIEEKNEVFEDDIY